VSSDSCVAADLQIMQKIGRKRPQAPSALLRCISLLLAQSGHFAGLVPMSAFGGKADIDRYANGVVFSPKSDLNKTKSGFGLSNFTLLDGFA
jgi:hypothetical protein